MFARGEVEIGRSPSFTVPLQSVVSADGYSYVFVLKRRQHRRAAARRGGRRARSAIEVVGGVEAGEMIVGKGAGFLKDGDLVNVADHRRRRLMNFVTWSIRNPVPVIVLFIGLTVAGLISFPKLGVQDRPDIEFPAVVVTVTYPGVAPTQMESEITRKVEDAVATIAAIEQMTSTVERGRVDDEHRVPLRHRPLRRARRRARRDDADPRRPAAGRERADRLSRRRRPAGRSSRGASRPTA